MTPRCVHPVSKNVKIDTRSEMSIFVDAGTSGGLGIRTLEEREPLAVFKTAAIGH
jgi:hypothetical protein